ncbi:MAG: hypothetical protein KatS3mg108_2703 [Isosphaeraceae bacterium]|jgi:hypothetical protein|nr:MAG: hypothetical protein KatS3mg108_2703 [Isosphaeraceae bacterium]
MGDGSVRFVRDSINSWSIDEYGKGSPLGAWEDDEGYWVNVPRPGVWQALSTRSGGEVINDDDRSQSPDAG